MTSRPAAPESDYAVALRLARETIERDDRENAAPSRVLRPGLTGEYRLAKALLSADNLLEREGINHDGTRRHDAELDRVLAMTDGEVRASLVAEGIDPDLAAQNTKYAINQVIQLIQLRRELSLAQTEIKGHMRVEDELKARIKKLEWDHYDAWAPMFSRLMMVCNRLEKGLPIKLEEVQGWGNEHPAGEQQLALAQSAIEGALQVANEAQARIAELEKDAARLNWLEDHHTLHTQVDILYIVDGYQVTLMHEDGFTTLSPAYEGHDLRSAIDAALKDRA